MANRKYILTIEYDPKSEEIEFIQEEIIPDKDDLDIPDGYSLMKKDLVDMWESDALTITTTEATIATMSGAVASAGHFNDSSVRYMRFTNLDDTNHITLTFRNQDNDEFAIKVDVGNSFMVFADNSGGMVGMFNATQDADAASDTALGSITNIQADAGASTVDLEMFIASA